MEINLLPCPLCSKPHFEGVDSLRSSLITVATSALKCPVCNEVLMGLDKLTIHLFSHITNNTVQKIDIIDQTTPLVVKETEEKSMDIVTSIPEENDARINEDKDFQTNTSNSETQNSSNDKKNCLRCDICNFYFNDENILEMHQKLLHQTSLDKKTGSYSYHCHLCTKKFKMRGSLMVHLRVAHYGFGHHIEEYDCNSANTLKETSQKSINPQLDSQSSDALNSQYSYTSPVVIVESSDVSMNSNSEELKSANKDNKQWECDVCSKLFTTKYFLKKHKRLHTGEMPYFCNLCNKSFTFQQSYHKHMLYHTSEKPHVCNECGRAFKELSTLHNHERIHSGERPFACETCGKCFRQRVSYLVHRRIHTGVMPYKCTACDKSFRYKVSQRSHKCTANPPGTVIRATDVPTSPQSGQNSSQESNNSHLTDNPAKSKPKKQSKAEPSPSSQEHEKIRPSSTKKKKSDKDNSNQESLDVDNSKAMVFNVGGQIIAQSFSFVPGCDIIAIHPSNVPDNQLHTPRIENGDSMTFEEISHHNADTKQVINFLEGSTETSSQLDANSQNNMTYETPDFFSMVMSSSPPILPDMQSLHLHSPKEKQDQEHILETINEESLKELLYGPNN